MSARSLLLPQNRQSQTSSDGKNGHATPLTTYRNHRPSDERQVHLGTSFYIRRGPGDFETVRKAEFLPNRAYRFAVGDKSFHGVERMGEHEKARNSLITIYFREEGHEY